MSTLLSTTPVAPNQQLGTGDNLALIIEEYSGIVEGTIQRKSALDGFVPMKRVVGTSTLTNDAIGEAVLGKVTPGTMPDGAVSSFSKNSVTIDTLIYARNTLPLLDSFQTRYDVRKELGVEHGKKIAKFRDQALFIQAAKAAAASVSPYGAVAGWVGSGSTVTLAASADRSDPAKLYAALAALFTQMEQKDVDVRSEDVILALTPADFYTLQQAEQLVNANYLTAEGNKLQDVVMLKAFGVPVVSTNNLPQSVISGHLLSNSRNSNAYDGDFSKLVALAFSARALLAGETIPLTSDVFYDKLTKQWFVDSHLSFGVTANRAEYAGQIVLP